MEPLLNFPAARLGSVFSPTRGRCCPDSGPGPSSASPALSGLRPQGHSLHSPRTEGEMMNPATLYLRNQVSLHLWTTSRAIL